jgi:hypothetical protein
MDDYKLPALYGKTRLVLLAVDPYLIHAYWEIAADDLDKAREQAGQAQEVLRFYKTSKMAEKDEPAGYFDVEIDLKSRTWYVHLWSAEESYFAELALKRKNGTLVRLVRSQVVHMPRTHPAISVDQHWMKVEPGERRAETVPPPPVEHKQPQEAAVSRVEEPAALRVSEIIDRKPVSKPIDSEEAVREEIKSVYAALHKSESGALIELRVPQAAGAVREAQARAEHERDSAKPQAMRAAGNREAQARAERERDSAKPQAMRAAGNREAQARAERERDSAKPQAMRAAGNREAQARQRAAGNNDRPGLFVPNRPDMDLAAMAERNLAAGLSSASLQKGRLEGPADSKK